MFGFLPEEGLVEVEVLQGGLDSDVDLVLEEVDHLAVESHAFCSFDVPLFQHLVVGLLLLKTHFN